MPWIKKIQPPAEAPARYSIGIMASFSFGEDDLIYAKKKRSEIIKFRDEMLSGKKYWGKTDRNRAKFLSNEAKDALKQQRGWDWCVGYLNGLNFGWRGFGATEEIAPYIDMAFTELMYPDVDILKLLNNKRMRK